MFLPNRMEWKYLCNTYVLHCTDQFLEHLDVKKNYNTSAVCSPGCANGGTCTAPNRCSCRTGWTGSTCATGKKLIMYCIVLNIYISAVCSSACRNGGTCTAPNRCSCRTGWTGSTCATGKKLMYCTVLIRC